MVLPANQLGLIYGRSGAVRQLTFVHPVCRARMHMHRLQLKI